MKISRKGDISITILVIGIMLICSIALFTFLASTIKMRNSFVGIGVTETLNSQIEEKFLNNENAEGLYFEKKETRGILFWAKEVIVFSAEYKGRG